jgi:CheY-like chemotaxis protein
MNKPRILLVEDEPIIGMDLQTILQNLGYDVPKVVTSGEEAVMKAEELKPDIILMDIILPGKMDGIDAIKEIKNNFDIPVIYLTSHTEKITFDRARETTPYGYLVKPAGKNDLYTAVETALHRHEMEKRLRESENELKIRNRISEIFLTIPDKMVYAEVLKVVLDTMKSEYGTFGYFNQDGAFIMPAISRDTYWEKCNIPDKDIIFGKGTFRGIWEKAVKEKRTIYSNNGPFNTPVGHIPIINTMALRSYIMAKLLVLFMSQTSYQGMMKMTRN